jgi:type VI secretion system FHA domain protein
MSETLSNPQDPTLLLQVQTWRNQPPAAPLSARFGAAGGLLGRGAGNDLVLDDASKYISRVHARIRWHDGRFHLAGEGVNPSIVDDRPIGPGLEAALADGTRIVVGDYALLATLELPQDALNATDATMFHVPVAAKPPLPPPLPLFEPPAMPAPPELPPFAAPALPAFPSAPAIDNLAGARILESHHGAPAGADPLGLNLLAGLDPASASAATLPPHAASGYAAPAYRGAESDHVAPDIQLFTMPPAAAQAIPAGYDPLADFLPPVVPAAAEVVEDAGPPTLAAEPLPTPTPPAPVPVLPVTIPMAVTVPAAPASADDTVLAALLDGLGLPALRPGGTPEAFAREVGQMLRAAVGGTIDVLMARALTKRESRIDMTMIVARANNPLKFFPDADSALTQMLGARVPGYLPPLDALAGAFDDLKAHELAVIAGTRAALAAVAQRFDPARIAARGAEPGRFDSLFPSAYKARLWERLVATHAELARDADEELQRLIGEKFSKAYDDQVERLRRERG